MATDKAPAFQFYPKDFLTDDAVLAMTNEQVGAYIQLLCHAWLMPEGLPPSMSALARLCHCTPKRFERCVWDGVRVKFRENGEGRWFNPRIEQVRDEQRKYRERRQQQGKDGADKRWGMAELKPRHSQTMATPRKSDSPSPSPSVRTTPKNGVVARYVERYRERCGGKSPVLTGKDTGQLAQLAKRLGVDDAMAWIDRVFAAPDDFWQKRGYPAASIPELINGLQAKAGKSWSASRTSGDGSSWCQHEPKCDHSQQHTWRLIEDAKKKHPASAETA